MVICLIKLMLSLLEWPRPDKFLSIRHYLWNYVSWNKLITKLENFKPRFYGLTIITIPLRCSLLNVSHLHDTEKVQCSILRFLWRSSFNATQFNTIVSDIIHSLTIWGVQNIGWISELPLIVLFFSENVHTPSHRRLFGLRFPSRECFAVELAYISLWKLTSLGFQIWVPFKLHLFSKFGGGIKWETFCFV